MAIRTRDEIITKVSDFLGDDADENGIEMLEDITDTIDDLTLKASDQTDWKAKYDELDASWRQRYKDRFSKTEDPTDGDTDLYIEQDTAVEVVDESPKTYEDLFRTESEV